MNNKIYIVFEDIFEEYVFNAEKIFKGVFHKEEDAQKLVDELKNEYSDIYYEEIEIK